VRQLQTGAITTDTTLAMDKIPAGKRVRVDRVTFAPHGTLAVDASHFFNLKLLKGVSTVVANWSTATGQQGTLTSGTPVELVLSATDANLILDAADVISAFFDETGSATMPAGVLTVEGRYVK
jgi:hypothetical protein